ncbi:hypothetical protein Q4574_05200 [Aliiglaciecola sp. 3_MG-2023]|uniref:hypothetical protein n=1 Tax=Aliiglaciecola sp. 3_MG-2023 TaxID=3062644 RepID=UPI0026E172B5|nr:hypothetical protein [Aliiglaciecola sp. 3_MG-2023]MDO6692667.1 hypothetical protein [Aliiglaciecola sp. 3_MG-2023]
MNKTLLTTLIFFSISATTAISKEVFSVSSKDRGITAFDYVVTEVEQREGVSILNIPKFQERSAQASRWLMCVYSELAISRNAEYWSSIYTDNSGDKVTVVLPQSGSLQDKAFTGIDFLGTQPKITPVALFKKFCGLK